MQFVSFTKIRKAYKKKKNKFSSSFLLKEKNNKLKQLNKNAQVFRRIT
jgi:hypothetical protein